MATITLSDILDDLRVADQALRKFEQRYWLSSEVFYELYSRSFLDDGSHLEDFAEWAGHCMLKRKREEALQRLSRQRVKQLQQQANGDIIRKLRTSPPAPPLHREGSLPPPFPGREGARGLGPPMTRRTYPTQNAR